MAYTHTTRLDLLYPLLYRTALEQQSTTPSMLARMSPPVVMRGRPFPCTPGMATLRHYHLSNEYRIGERKGPAATTTTTTTPRYVLVTGADSKFYPFLRVAIHSIQQQFPAGSYRLIVYDLDGDISSPPSGREWMLEELRQVCQVELRVFHSATRFPAGSEPELLDPLSFSWKVLAIAEVFRDLDPDTELLIYLDSSVRFQSPPSDFGPLYMDAMNDGVGGRRRLSPVQMPRDSSGHSIQWATHPTMYTWLPMDPLLGRLTMHEANFMVWRKTETSRQLLKWAVLCAITRECMVPRGQRVECRVGWDPDAACHRQDQSLTNILVGNLEVDWWMDIRFADEQQRHYFVPHILNGLNLPAGKHPNPMCAATPDCPGSDGRPKIEVLRRSEDPNLKIVPESGKC